MSYFRSYALFFCKFKLYFFQLAHDLELMFGNDRHTDFKIICRRGENVDKVFDVHRIVLAARSPVFSAMLEPHTEEAINGRVFFNDIDPDVMRELLFL